jgi:hypothetical protein
MIQNFVYYLSVLIICLINIFFTIFPKFNSKLISFLLIISLLVFIYGNFKLFVNEKEEKYIYVKPKYKPIVISWDNPLAQKII